MAKGNAKKQTRYSKDLLNDLLERMLLIRRFEEKAGQMYGLRKIGGFCHLYIGQEAIAVGAVAAIDLKRDYASPPIAITAIHLPSAWTPTL